METKTPYNSALLRAEFKSLDQTAPAKRVGYMFDPTKMLNFDEELEDVLQSMKKTNKIIDNNFSLDGIEGIESIKLFNSSKI